MYCEQCGAFITETNPQFCPECGTPIPATAPTEEPSVATPPAPVPEEPIPEKKKRRLWPIFLVIAIVLILVAVGVFVLVPLFTDEDDTDKHDDNPAVDSYGEIDPNVTTFPSELLTTLATTITTVADDTTAVMVTTTTTTTVTTTTAAPTTSTTHNPTSTVSPSIPTTPPVSVVSNADITSVVATSHLDESDLGFVHSADRLVDADLSTAWVEGAGGVGVNESVTVNLRAPRQMSGFTIYAGYQKSSDQYYRNARPKTIGITFSDGSYQECTLHDTFGAQTITFNSPVVTSSFSVTILSVYEGELFEDTAISDLSLF